MWLKVKTVYTIETKIPKYNTQLALYKIDIQAHVKYDNESYATSFFLNLGIIVPFVIEAPT